MHHLRLLFTGLLLHTYMFISSLFVLLAKLSRKKSKDSVREQEHKQRTTITGNPDISRLFRNDRNPKVVYKAPKRKAEVLNTSAY